jgi:uncharacterized protein (TIGR02001 family)
MRKTSHMLATASIFCCALSTPVSAVELTANFGMVTDYIFRGIDASNGRAAAQGGADFGAGIFYLGTWVSTVEVPTIDPVTMLPDEEGGVEIDLYTGLAGEVGDFSWSVGGTYYTYSNSSDDNDTPLVDDIFEGNLNLGWRWFTVSINPGRFDADPNSQDYVFYSLTGEVNGFYGTVGHWNWDEDDVEGIDGNYFEAGYSNTLSINDVELFDYSFAYIYAEDELIANNQSENSLVFGITKNFSIVE